MAGGAKSGYATGINQFLMELNGEGSRNNENAGIGENGRRTESGLKEDAKAPQIFYHGTNDNVRDFDLEHPNKKDFGWLSKASYLWSDPAPAGSCANIKSGESEPKVIPVYVKLTNMFIAGKAMKETLQDGKSIWAVKNSAQIFISIG